MRRLALLLGLLVPLIAQESPDSPAAWSIDPSSGYALTRVDGCLDSGSPCSELRKRDGGAPGERAYLLRSFDAAQWRGKRIRSSTALRLQAPAVAHAQVFLRIDRPAGSGESSYSAPLKTPSEDWTMIETAGTVDEDAERVTIGVVYGGWGSLWVGEPEIESVSE